MLSRTRILSFAKNNKVQEYYVISSPAEPTDKVHSTSLYYFTTCTFYRQVYLI